jgi:hypothetical protein
MGGLSLDMGLQGQGALGSGYGPAATPAAAGASPQGPTTIGQKAFGIVTGGGGYSAAHVGLLSVGGLSIVALCFIYWSLPRLGGSDADHAARHRRRDRPVLGFPALHRHGQHRQGEELMGAKVFGVITLAVACIALADLVHNANGTKVLTGSAVQAETVGTNALLGQTTK